MKDFLAAEWSTVLIVAIALGLLYVLFVREEKIAKAPVEDGEILVPGQSYEELSIGDPLDRVTSKLGAPSTETELDLGLRALAFESRGLTVYLKEDEVVGIQRDLTPDPNATTPLRVLTPKGVELTRTWSKTQQAELGAFKSSFTLEAEKISRYDGAMVIFKGDENIPSSMIVVDNRVPPPQPH